MGLICGHVGGCAGPHRGHARLILAHLGLLGCLSLIIAGPKHQSEIGTPCVKHGSDPYKIHHCDFRDELGSSMNLPG